MRDQLVNETIDGRILRLLGLEDTFDLDYETYLVLLREAQVKGKNKIAAEEQALLANERKRIRGKTGRFKPKTKKIKVENVTTIGQRLLPASRQKGGQLSMPVIKSLENIGKTVESITVTLKDQSNNDKKTAEEERKGEENKKRQAKEEKLESGVKKVVAAAKKLFAPVQSIFDTLFNYLFYTFLGSGIQTALNWLSDPANKEKVNTLGKFIEDFWPALTGAAVLFLTPFGGFIRGITFEIAKLGIRFPLITAAVLGVTAAGVLKGKAEESKEKQLKESGYLEKEAKRTGKKPEEIKKQLEDIEQKSEFFRGFSNINQIASGGFIDENTGLRISGAGPDTQLTALKPGEVVMNVPTVKAVGANNLLALNSKYGGPNANKPKFANNIRLAQNGGMIGSIGRFLSSSGRVMAPRGEQFSGQQTTVQKILGITVPGSERPTTYQQSDIERYNRLSRERQLVTGSKLYKSPDGYSQYTAPTTRTQSRTAATAPVSQERRRERALTGAIQLNRDLEKTLKNVPGAGGYADILRQSGDLGEQELKNQLEIERQMKILGPQSRVLPPPPPSGRGGFNVINLPPITQQVASASPMTKSAGTEVPSFSAIAPGNKRMDNAAIYGLVG